MTEILYYIGFSLFEVAVDAEQNVGEFGVLKKLAGYLHQFEFSSANFEHFAVLFPLDIGSIYSLQYRASLGDIFEVQPNLLTFYNTKINQKLKCC